MQSETHIFFFFWPYLKILIETKFTNILVFITEKQITDMENWQQYNKLFYLPLEIASVAVVGVSAAVEIPLGAASAPNCGI